MFYGFLTAAGAFRDMRAIRADATSSQIAAILGEWQFRPARSNNVATDIQVALIVPPTDEDRRRIRGF